MNEKEINMEVYNIPYDIFQKSNLKKLNLTIDEFDLGNSEILEPNFLIKLTALEELDLTGVIISPDIFSNEICKLTSLTKLTLMYANLSVIPDDIINLVNLEKLCFRGNKIDALPENFNKLTKLKSLNLIGNEFKDIPDKLLKMDQLTDINFGGNPLNSESKKLLGEFGDIIKPQ
jgi:Leucine-rich repeat (LRR) protein